MNHWTPEKIRSFRKGAGLTQAALAERLGVAGNFIWMLEKGVRTPSKTLMLLLDCIEKQHNEKEKGKESNPHGKGTI